MKLPLSLPRPSNRLLRLWGAAWLVICLLLSQTLGQLHAVQHGGPARAGHAVAAVHNHAPFELDGAYIAHGADRAHDAHDAHHGDDVRERFFPLHSSNSDCRLYDQASMSDALTTPAAAVMPAHVPSFLVAIFQGEAIARWAALFDARGPPLTV